MLIHLTPNHLTEDENDFMAVVKHNPKTLQIEDIAQIVMRDFHGIDLETIIAIYRNFEHAIIRELALGNRVDTILYHSMATVSGVFKGKAAHFDPRQGHAIGIALTICPPALKLIAEGTIVENIGLLPVGPEISTVEDTYTNTRAGEATRSIITPRFALDVKGKNIRIASDNKGTHSSDCGVFLMSTIAPFTRTRVPDNYFTVNQPSQITFTLPILLPGTYWLEIVTQSTANTAKLTNEPRTVRFEIPLVVEQE